MSESHLSELLAAAVRLGVPLLLAALGEILVQRSGLVNVGIEGMMLAGCLVAVLADLASGSPWLGFAAGTAAGILLAAVFASLVVGARGDAIVTGTGINLLALGLTGFIYQTLYGRTGTALAVTGFKPLAIPGLADLPLVGPALFAQPAPAYVAYAAVLVLYVFLGRTGLGLRLRAAGEAPHAAAAAGASVAWLRATAVLAGGAFAGAGGAALALAHARTFVEGMTAGRGFIALALVIVARLNPWTACAASLLFGLASALQFEIQALGLSLPYQLVRMAPYLATLAVLILTSPRWRRS